MVVNIQMQKLREFIILIYNFMQTKPNIDRFKEGILNTYKLNDNEVENLNTFWGIFLKMSVFFQILEFKKSPVLNFIELINSRRKVYEVISNDISNKRNLFIK